MIPEWALKQYTTLTEVNQSNNTLVLGGLIHIQMDRCEDTVCRGRLTFQISDNENVEFMYFHNNDGLKSCEKRYITPIKIKSSTFLNNIDLYKKQIEVMEAEQIIGLVFNITTNF